MDACPIPLPHPQGVAPGDHPCFCACRLDALGVQHVRALRVWARGERRVGRVGVDGLSCALRRRHCGGAIPALQKHSTIHPMPVWERQVRSVLCCLRSLCSIPRTRCCCFCHPMPAVLAGVLFFWYESRMQQRGRTRIAHDAHLGGAIVGVAWVVLLSQAPFHIHSGPARAVVMILRRISRQSDTPPRWRGA